MYILTLLNGIFINNFKKFISYNVKCCFNLIKMCIKKCNNYKLFPILYRENNYTHFYSGKILSVD